MFSGMAWLSWLKLIQTDKKETFTLQKDAWVEVHTYVCVHEH